MLKPYLLTSGFIYGVYALWTFPVRGWFRFTPNDHIVVLGYFNPLFPLRFSACNVYDLVDGILIKKPSPELLAVTEKVMQKEVDDIFRRRNRLWQLVFPLQEEVRKQIPEKEDAYSKMMRCLDEMFISL